MTCTPSKLFHVKRVKSRIKFVAGALWQLWTQRLGKRTSRVNLFTHWRREFTFRVCLSPVNDLCQTYKLYTIGVICSEVLLFRACSCICTEYLWVVWNSIIHCRFRRKPEVQQDPCFGVNMLLDIPGTVSVGDPVYAVSRDDAWVKKNVVKVCVVSFCQL